MRTENIKHWNSGFQIRGGYFWTLAFRIGKYGIMAYYPMRLSVYKLI